MAFPRIRSRHVASVLAVFVQSSAVAQGTDRQREACMPDAMRLCGAYIPDVDRITACLRNNGTQLSRPCYDIFFPHAEPRQYVGPRRPTQRYEDE
jgi:hypothetical protein